MIELGQTFNHHFVYTQAQVAQFAQISGDNNPIHLDQTYAANTPFKKPIIHGIFSASIFSKYFGTITPGEGTIYLKQSLEFLRPMYVETDYEAVMTVVAIESDKNRATISCKIIDKGTGKTTITGEAVLMHKEKIQ